MKGLDYEATRQGRLPHLHLGRYIRYHPDQLAAWLEGHATVGASRPIRRIRG
jgi:hypothetical protein